MQYAFDFRGDRELDRLLVTLRRAFPLSPGDWPRVEPIAQLAKSILSTRSYDSDARQAFRNLVEHFPRWADIAEAEPQDIERVIDAVSFPTVKAKQLKAAMATVRRRQPDFDLGFLGKMPVPEGLAWLEQLDGVGRKIAASVLNFSTLRRSAFVVDANVLRVLCRLGHVDRNANTYDAYDFVMGMTPDWTAQDYTEFHVLLKILGQKTCRDDRPLCHACPMAHHCARVDVPVSARQRRAELAPV
jgi:endonuclease-3